MPPKPAQVVDPYVTLGLAPGASSAEVKRAYRRLAKTFHPDSAGEQAIPRFLAIQAAYEQITTGRVVLGGSRGGRAAAAAPQQPASEPWRADPARARAARERARTGTPGAGSGTTGGARTGAPGSRGADPNGTGASGARPSSGASAGGRKATGTSGTGAPSGRKRATRKATMGSTSYDEARDPADATWSGASWYGPSTGEYWIVNPREYADPRKHGPDYQQRARRPLHNAATDSAATDNAATDGAPERPTTDPGLGTPTEPAADTTTSGPSAAFDRAGKPARARRGRPSPRWASQATEAGWAQAGEARPASPDLEARAAAPLRWLGEPADDAVRRLGLALVAWPPIGLAAAALIGNATGCATFAAQCDGADAMLPWLAQAVILGLLLLVLPVTRILASGTIAVLVGLVPITAFLLAVGGGDAPQAAGVMAVLLAVIWLVGVAWGTAMQLRGRGPAQTRRGT